MVATISCEVTCPVDGGDFVVTSQSGVSYVVDRTGGCVSFVVGDLHDDVRIFPNKVLRVYV